MPKMSRGGRTKARRPAAHREIVVGVDDPEQSATVVGFAFEEVVLRRARLLAVHALFSFLPAVRPLGAPTAAERAAFDRLELSANAAAQLEAMLAGWQEKYPQVQTGWEVMHAHPGRVLAGASAHADLVVLGRRAARGLHAPGVGSVTHGVLSHAHGPVVTVPGD
jgi:nucleotide-binding universal stress UspA family protein